jgi:hypothetical protein
MHSKYVGLVGYIVNNFEFIKFGTMFHLENIFGCANNKMQNILSQRLLGNEVIFA